MQIKINSHHVHLQPAQEETIALKVKHLAGLADRLGDESSHLRVDFSHDGARRPEDVYNCSATFFVPHGTLRAEAHGESPESAFDEVVDKLRPQIEHYKAKLHHLNDRNKPAD